ncbi:MAG TPA: hypothetical protein VF203_08235 [Burkholderiales bacterium]
MAATAMLLGVDAIDARADGDPDRFTLRLGAFRLAHSETEISARQEPIPFGTTVNFERDLNLEEEVTTPRVAGYFRFNPTHRLDYSWYRLEREGSRIIDRELSFGTGVFPIGTNVQSSLDFELGKLAYTWSFYRSDDVELGASFGAYLLSYKAAVRRAGSGTAVDVSVSSPLPMLGFRLDYSIGRRWHALFDFEAFYVELGEDTRGAIDDLQLALEYRLRRHLVLGVSVNRLVIDVTDNSDSLRWSISDLYRGEQIYVGVRF